LPEGPVPQFGVYLLGRDPGPFGWDHRWVRWQDLWVPASSSEAIDALVEAFDRSARERVEVACAGGAGRTGAALAVLARLGGVAPDDAVAWVRARHAKRAAETPWQRRWARTVELPR